MLITETKLYGSSSSFIELIMYFHSLPLQFLTVICAHFRRLSEVMSLESIRCASLEQQTKCTQTSSNEKTFNLTIKVCCKGKELSMKLKGYNHWAKLSQS